MVSQCFDGKIWANLVSNSTINSDILKIGYHDGTWLLVGDGNTNNDNILYNTADPTNFNDWNQSIGTPFGTGVANDVLYAVDKWVAVGAHDSTAENIWYSVDGITWTSVSGPFGVAGIANKIYYGERYVGGGRFS